MKKYVKRRTSIYKMRMRIFEEKFMDSLPSLLQVPRYLLFGSAEPQEIKIDFKIIPAEILKVADEEQMNPNDLLNNIKGTLQTVSVEETASIYEVSIKTIQEIKDLECSKK